MGADVWEVLPVLRFKHLQESPRLEKERHTLSRHAQRVLGPTRKGEVSGVGTRAQGRVWCRFNQRGSRCMMLNFISGLAKLWCPCLAKYLVQLLM